MQCISWAFYISMSRPTGRPCFCMTKDQYNKSSSDSASSTGVGPVLFDVKLFSLFLHFFAKVWRGMSYSRTAFTCDISRVSTSDMALSMPHKE